MAPYAFLVSRAAFHDFLAAWETSTLPKNQWTHAAHVAVGAAYTVQFGDNAFEQIKKGILRYNETVGTVNTDSSGYHETLTRLWSIVLANVTQGMVDPWAAACRAVEIVGEERNLHRLYYSFDVVRARKARRIWVPPDLKGPF